MRRVIVSNIASLDGYYEGPGGVMDLPMDAAFDAYNLERMLAADTVLVGATSYHGFNEYWPPVAEHPAVPADDPTAPMYDEVNRAISRRWSELDVVVVSDTLAVDPRAPWSRRTTVVARDAVAGWKQDGDGECVVFGSRATWHGLWAQNLVDELHVMVGAVALGAGRPLLDQPTGLHLVGVRTFDGSDNVLLRYAPA